MSTEPDREQPMWTIEAFDAMDAGAAARALAPCCASPAWIERVAAGRPYGSAAALGAAAMRAFDGLDEAGIDAAHAAHPPIGAAPADAGVEGGWSREEQSGAGRADESVRAALAEAGEAYRRRFGRVFLICATGLSAEDILAAARRRLGNDDAAERAEARAELRKIVALRLDKAFRDKAVDDEASAADGVGTETR